MKLPRDVSGPDLVKALHKLGYQVNRQRGSHVRVTTQQGGENHEVVPNHHRKRRPGCPLDAVVAMRATNGIVFVVTRATKRSLVSSELAGAG